MNAGIQDATNLGWKLAFAGMTAARGSVLDSLLDSYQTERRPVAHRVVALTRLLFWAEAGTTPLASFIRARLVPAAAPILPLLLRRPRLMADGVRVLSGLGLGYRTGPICLQGDRPSRHGPRPGARLADQGVTVKGRPYRLHALIARPGVHLLLEHQAPWPSCELRSPYIHTHRVEDWPGRGVVAVRPDGYVGYSSAITDGEEIRSWLSTIGAHQQQ